MPLLPILFPSGMCPYLKSPEVPCSGDSLEATASLPPTRSTNELIVIVDQLDMKA